MWSGNPIFRQRKDLWSTAELYEHKITFRNIIRRRYLTKHTLNEATKHASSTQRVRRTGGEWHKLLGNICYHHVPWNVSVYKGRDRITEILRIPASTRHRATFPHNKFQMNRAKCLLQPVGKYEFSRNWNLYWVLKWRAIFVLCVIRHAGGLITIQSFGFILLKQKAINQIKIIGCFGTILNDIGFYLNIIVFRRFSFHIIHSCLCTCLYVYAYNTYGTAKTAGSRKSKYCTKLPLTMDAPNVKGFFKTGISQFSNIGTTYFVWWLKL